MSISDETCEAVIEMVNPSMPPPAANAPRLHLAPGDILPRIRMAAAGGETVDLGDDVHAGHFQAILIGTDYGALRHVLVRLVRRENEFAARGAQIFAIHRGRASPGKDPAEPDRPIMGDITGALVDVLTENGRPTLVLVAPNRHIAALVPALDTEKTVDAALTVIDDRSGPFKPVAASPHPPILIVPDVLSPEDCQRLMNVYAMRGNVFVEPGHGDTGRKTDFKMRIPEYGRGDRVDHWVMEADTYRFIDERLQSRLFPEIEKAFQYRITRREIYRIASYEGARGGELHGHRDNTEPRVAHRRFAISVNLNTEAFEGGDIVFPEYGGHRYRPASGAGICFSCSLLHEIHEVTRGRRYVLLIFAFGEH